MTELRNATQLEIVDRLKTEEDGTIYYHPGSLYAGEVQDMRERGIIRTGQDRAGYLWMRLAESDENEDPQ